MGRSQWLCVCIQDQPMAHAPAAAPQQEPPEPYFNTQRSTAVRGERVNAACAVCKQRVDPYVSSKLRGGSVANFCSALFTIRICALASGIHKKNGGWGSWAKALRCPFVLPQNAHKAPFHAFPAGLPWVPLPEVGPI